MRIAYFDIDMYGHNLPNFDLLAELVRSGAVVRAYSFNKFARYFECSGVELRSIDALCRSPEKGSQRTLPRLTEKLTQDARLVIPELQQEFESFRFDAVISGQLCIWGFLLARSYDIPLVKTYTLPVYSLREKPQITNREWADYFLHFSQSTSNLLKTLTNGQKLGRMLSVPVRGFREFLHDYDDSLKIQYLPKKLIFPESDTASGEIFAERPGSIRKQVEGSFRLPPEASNKLVIYLSFGTLKNSSAEELQLLGSVLEDERYWVLVSAPDDANIVWPANFRVVEFVPQLAVLPQVDFFISHCGANSMMEAILCGVPIVAVPQAVDQFFLSSLVEEWGIGISIRKLSVQSLQRALIKITEGHYVKSIQAVQHQMADQTSTSAVVQRILQHAGTS